MLRSDRLDHRQETVAVVVVTFNRADLLRRMLAGLAALTRQPDAVIVVDNASTDHTRQVLEEAGNRALLAIHEDRNLGGAGGFHRGVREAYDRGYDRIWLMDDDVVPAPDCLDVLLAQDEACLMAVREDLHGRLVEKAATVLRPLQPAGDQAEDRDGRDHLRQPRRDAGEGGAPERRVRGVHGPA